VSFPEEVFMSREVPEKVEKLFLLFKKAVEEERKAQKMYAEALLLCEDKETARIVAGFHRQEVQHEKGIIQQYNKLRKRYRMEDE
jgi:rubrerythrin